MTRDSDHKSGRRDSSDIPRREGMRREVDTVGAGGQSDVGPLIDEYLRLSRRRQGYHLARQGQQISSRQILFPDLDALDALADRRLDSLHQRIEATHSLPVRDVVAEHLQWLVVPLAGAGAAQRLAVAHHFPLE